MAACVDQPVSPPGLSLWRRLSKRDTIPKITTTDIFHQPSSPKSRDTTKPTKIRRREAQVYKDAPGTSPTRKASLHLPISVPNPSPPSPPSSVTLPSSKTPTTATTKYPTTKSTTTTTKPATTKPRMKPTTITKAPPKPTSTALTTKDPQDMNKKKENISILQVQRIHVPPTRMKPRVVSLHRVLPTDQATSPFPPSPQIHTVSWNVFLGPEQVYSLVMGFCPTTTDDKWFVYSQGPDKTGKLKVHFHRSWTGMKIAELFIVVDLKGEGAGTIVGVKWNGTTQTNSMDEDEAKYMVSTTCSWVLGVDLENGLFPAMQFE